MRGPEVLGGGFEAKRADLKTGRLILGLEGSYEGYSLIFIP